MKNNQDRLIKYNGDRLRKLSAAVALLAMLAAVMCIPAMRSYAAGTINVSVSDIEGLGTDFEGFTFDLYEVGGYDGPNFKLDPDYQDVNVQIPKEEDYNASKQASDPTWQEAWLSAARTLSKYVPGDGTSEPAATFTGIKSGKNIVFHSDKNALYLLKGRTARVGNQNYTPVPMLVRTLNGEESYTIDGTLKIEITPVVFEHTLIKEWAGESGTSLRPASVDVGIYYGETLVDTVTLGGEDGVWTYSWESEETGSTYYYINSAGERSAFTPGANDNKWDVKEIVTESDMSEEARAAAANLRYYSPSYEYVGTDTSETFNISNTFAAKGLELTKSIDVYDADGQNVTFSFKVEGYASDGEDAASEQLIYTNHIGVSFSPADGLAKVARIDSIPATVSRIVVTEEYSGNYKPETAAAEAQFDTARNMWTVKFNNIHDDTHGPKGGVVNKYEHDKDPAQDPGSAASTDAGGSGSSDE